MCFKFVVVVTVPFLACFVILSLALCLHFFPPVVSFIELLRNSFTWVEDLWETRYAVVVDKCTSKLRSGCSDGSTSWLNKLLLIPKLMSIYNIPFHYLGTTAQIQQAKTWVFILTSWHTFNSMNFKYHLLVSSQISKLTSPFIFAAYHLREAVCSLEHKLVSTNHNNVIWWVGLFKNFQKYLILNAVYLEHNIMRISACLINWIMSLQVQVSSSRQHACIILKVKIGVFDIIMHVCSSTMVALF